MSNKKELIPNKTEDGVIKEEINLQFHWYLLAFFIIYYLSYIIPIGIFFSFIMFFYIPFYLGVSNLLSIFLDLGSLLISFLLPIILIACYSLHLFFIALITRVSWKMLEKRSPSKNGIIPRNIPSKTLNYYHMRSFLIKYGKNAFQKSPFPWLLIWFYNFVGSNKIGKGTTIEEQFGADKFVTIGENSYIGVNSGFSSHSLEGIFGNISYFEIKIGDNVTTAGINCIAPGVTINDDSYLLPLASATKHSNLKGKNYYFGVPLRKIFKKKIMKYLGITEKDIERDAVLRKKRENNKN